MMRLAVRLKFIVLLITLISGCNSSDSPVQSENQSFDIFPISLLDKQCLEDLDPNTYIWERVIIEFDDEGYLRFGRAAYDDNQCANKLYQRFGLYSTYRYRLGDTVNTVDGSIATILFSPDPEAAGDYGTVFLSLSDNEICFAEEAISIMRGSISFQPTDENGDFSNQSMDYDSCLEIQR
jgi:hypothetical protein